MSEIIKINEDKYEQYHATIKGFETWHEREFNKIFDNQFSFMFNLKRLHEHTREFKRLSTLRLWLLNLHIKAIHQSIFLLGEKS